MAKLFGSAVIDQAMLSGVSLIIGLILIRNTTTAEYGYFVLAQTAIQLMVMAQDAWVGGPLTILAPKRERGDAIALLSDVRKDHHRWSWYLLPAGLAASGAGWLAGWVDVHQAVVLAITCFTLWAVARRELLRTVLLINRRQPILLAINLIYVAVLLSLIGAAIFLDMANAPLAILALGVASVCSYLAARYVVGRMEGWDQSMTADQRASYWKQAQTLGNWALFGAVVYWLYAQGYNNLVAFKIDAAAVGMLASARLLMTPLLLMTHGLRGVLIPMSAGWLRHEGPYPVIRRISIILVGGTLAGAGYLGLIWLLRDWLFSEVLRTQLPDRDTLLLYWGAIILIGVVRDFIQIVLLAMEQFKPLAGLTVASAVTALSTMWFALDHAGLVGALWGIAAAEVISLVGSLALLVYAVQNYRPHAENTAATSASG